MRTLSGKLTLCSMGMMLCMWLAVGVVLVLYTAGKIIDQGYDKAVALAYQYRYDSFLQAYDPTLEDDWWIEHALEQVNEFVDPAMNRSPSSTYLQYNFTWMDSASGDRIFLPVHTMIGIRLQSDEAPQALMLLLDELSPSDLAQLSKQTRAVFPPPLSATGTRDGLLFYVDTLTVGDQTYSTGRTGGTDRVSIGDGAGYVPQGSYILWPSSARTEEEWSLLLNARDWMFSDQSQPHNPWRDYLSCYVGYRSVILNETQEHPDVWVGVVLAATPLKTALEENGPVLLRLLVLVPILGLVFACVIHHMVVSPLQKTQEDFQKVARLDFTGLSGDERRKDEIGELNRSLRTMSGELQRRWDDERALEGRRREFVSAASHELKTPLALMRGYTEGLMQNIGDREEYLASMEREIDRMNALVLEMLEQTRLEGMEGLRETETVDLTALVERLLTQMAPLFQGLRCSVHLDQGITCPGNPQLLERGIGNLLSNAARYCTPGGQVRLELRNGPVLTLENDADPIPEEELPRLFEMFYRGDKARDRSGSGMGLAIAQRIFSLHHLRCQAENIPGGVRFTLAPDLEENP